MEEIVQLRSYEYQKLFEKSNYNENRINKEAENLYKKRGTYGLEISVRTDDYSDDIKVVASSTVKDWDGQFPISYKDKKRIVKYVDWKMQEFLVARFGDDFLNRNMQEDKLKELSRLKLKFLSLTVTGWLLASTLFLALIF